MAAVGETLTNIETIQEEISRFIETHGSEEFLRDIMSFTTAYWFELAGHACLDASKAEVGHTGLLKKYYDLRQRQEILEEYIRWNNIGGLFIVWNIYESYIRRVQRCLLNSDDSSLRDVYPKILKEKQISGKQLSEMLGEFEAIRLTRNSLHAGGIYRNAKKRIYNLRNEKYVLEQGKPVKPIRLMSVLQVFWDHYKQLV